MDKKQVALEMDELITMKIALKCRIKKLERMIESFGDSDGVWAEDKETAQKLYEKLRNL